INVQFAVAVQTADALSGTGRQESHIASRPQVIREMDAVETTACRCPIGVPHQALCDALVDEPQQRGILGLTFLSLAEGKAPELQRIAVVQQAPEANVALLHIQACSVLTKPI